MAVDYSDVDSMVLHGYIDPLPSHVEGIRLAPIQEQADIAERYETETLYACTDPWALRHTFVNEQTGEVIRARCDRWSCRYCGPRKTDIWRQLIAMAKPTLHIVLSRAGTTVEEAARALTTFIQYLRRGSKGRGKEHIGARLAYLIEYLAVLERHLKEESGFHWHLLVSGLDFVPKEVIDAAWESATHGRNKFAYIERVKNERAIGYVTKYLTKDITRSEKGIREERREAIVLGLDDEGNMVEHKETYTVQVESHARRIRYSRHFFPASTEELRHRLFAELDNDEGIERDVEQAAPAPTESEEVTIPTRAEAIEDEEWQGQPVQQEEPQKARWVLREVEPFTNDYEEYLRRKRRVVLEKLKEVRAGTWHISGRVLSIWAFQGSKRYQYDNRLREAG